MLVDNSQTVNRFIMLDALPLPKIEELVNTVTQYKIHYTLDLKSTYHQVPIADKDKAYIGFEVISKLYQFCRVHFGVTNSMASYQKIIYKFVNNNSLSNTFVNLINITICGSQ